MEFSLFEILTIFQKVDLISRFLAKIDIADFLMIATVLGVIYTKLNSGANKITNNVNTQITSFKEDTTKAFTAFDKSITDLKTDSITRFNDFDKKIDDFKQESKERLTENTKSIKEMGIALKRNIDSDKLELKSDISSINQRVDTLNQTVINLVANKKLK
jgi:hypothetical protein